MIEARYQRNHTKIIITIGMIATIPLIVSFFVLQQVWLWIGGAIAFAIAGFALLIMVKGSANIYHRIIMQSIERDIARKDAMYLHSDHKTTTIHIPTQRIVSHAHAITATASATDQEPAPQNVDFLSVLPRIQTCVIVGGQASGKTALLKWIAYRRKQAGNVYVIDPHTDNWPAHYVCGVGREWAHVAALLADLESKMDARYKGIENPDPLTLVMDEWLSLVENVDNAAQVLKVLITEGRKVNINVFVGSHTDRARQLGLTGSADIREGLTLVYLHVNQATRERSAMVNFGQGNEPLLTPGPFTMPYETPEKMVFDGQKTCNVCGNSVTDDKVYCSNACKQKAYRIRRNQRSVTVLPEK